MSNETSKTRDIETRLAENELFREFLPEYISRLAANAHLEKFEPNAYIFHAGRLAQHCYLLESGHVAVEIFDGFRGPIVVDTLAAPSVLGWSWLSDTRRWCFDARAVDPVYVISLDAGRLQELCDSDRNFGYEFLKRFTKVFTKRLHATRFQLLDVCSHFATHTTRRQG